MILRFKRIHPDAVLPAYAHPSDAGMDIRSVENLVIPAGKRALVHTGLVMLLPPLYEAQVRPRSGLALKHGVTVLNTPGTVDEGYRGEIRVILINHGTEVFRVEPGMRIAQLVICPVLRVDTELVPSLDDTARGAAGFGSTGV